MKKNYLRQSTLNVIQDFDFSDFVGKSGVAQLAVEVPGGAVAVGGQLVVDTAFNSGVSDTFKVGDSAADNRYGAAINGQAEAATDLTITGHSYSAQDNVTLTWTGAGAAPTAGAGRLIMQYVVAGRAHCTQG